MEKLHLLCNSHIDVVWLWRWNEGLAEAISTFRVAADFCEQYDGFIFNHNEAILYEWVEEYEPELFARIQRLVAAGKWRIMGGWYLQPDCVMTSGESLLAQIDLGKTYFKEKFDAEQPTTAIGFDAFGHSKGLVQVLTKSGYDSYLFARPFDVRSDLLWEGFDGSRVLGHGIYGGYGALKGQALNKVKRYIEKEENKQTGLCLWGIGNHGGGPSKIDLEALNEFAKTAGLEVIHSTAEDYMKEIDRSQLRVQDTALGPCMVGCYTSMVRIKQANRRLENKIALTEKAMSYASMVSDFKYEVDALKEAKKALAYGQFHDILPGSAIRPVEEDSLRTFHYGEEIADRLLQKAFFKLCEGQEKAEEGTIPILIFNPHPFEIEGEFEVDFLLQNQNHTENEITIGQVYDENGILYETQNEKAECTINLDWTKKISFHGKAAASSITRFNCQLKKVKTAPDQPYIDAVPQYEYKADDIEVSNDRMRVRISRKTGLIELYEVDGKVLIENSGKLEVYRDNEDSYGSAVSAFTDYEGCFTLMSDAEANSFIGYPEESMPNVRVIEDGAVRMKIQAMFEYRHSTAVVEYTIPKNGIYMDVNVLIYSAERNKMVKYTIDSKLSGTPYGETVFGYDKLFDDERESVYHKWCGIRTADDALYVVNNGIYGGSFTGSSIKLSLLRTPLYASLPNEGAPERPIAPHDRCLAHIDLGERRFSFRITTEKNIEREAMVYNETPQLLSFFPSGEGEKKTSVIQIDNPNVFLSSVRKTETGYKLTLYNFSEEENDAEIHLIAQDKTWKLHFTKYELKFVEI